MLLFFLTFWLARTFGPMLLYSIKLRKLCWTIFSLVNNWEAWQRHLIHFFDWTWLAQKILLDVIQSLIIDDAHKNVIQHVMKNYRRTRSIRKGWNDLKEQNFFKDRTRFDKCFFLKKQITRQQQESWDCLESTYIGCNSFLFG